VTVCGRVKGTIRAVRVKLQNGGAVEGDIFHRTLSIDENSQFEGSSRRVENPTEPSSSVDAKGPQKSSRRRAVAAPKRRPIRLRPNARSNPGSQGPQLPACCARAASGQLAAAAPSSAMNSRLLIRSPRRRGRAAWAALRGRAACYDTQFMAAKTSTTVRLLTLIKPTPG
jgi:hypothetical protein